jgi:hypothetical protein
MPKFHVIAGPDATPAYPIVRKIGPADLKDALAKGVDDFWAMPTSLVFLGLIYPIVGVSRRLCSAPAFSAHGGFRSGWSTRSLEFYNTTSLWFPECRCLSSRHVSAAPLVAADRDQWAECPACCA